VVLFSVLDGREYLPLQVSHPHEMPAQGMDLSRVKKEESGSFQLE
jgi:hypothetical protein